MFILINQMDRIDEQVGRVLSVHRTPAAASRADAKLQREIRRNNGKNSFLPTTCRFATGKVRVGQIVYRDDVQSLTDEQETEYLFPE